MNRQVIAALVCVLLPFGLIAEEDTETPIAEQTEVVEEASEPEQKLCRGHEYGFHSTKMKEVRAKEELWKEKAPRLRGVVKYTIEVEEGPHWGDINHLEVAWWHEEGSCDCEFTTNPNAMWRLNAGYPGWGYRGFGTDEDEE